MISIAALRLKWAAHGSWEALSMDMDTRQWPADDGSRVPYWIYTDEDVYRSELDRIWYGRNWLYAGLEAEVPEVGSYRTTTLGERSVIVVRSAENEISVLENRCRHRGVEICQARGGKVDDITCPYHRWSYALNGTLQGVPFKRGVKGQGGMPKDFDQKEHGLHRLKVEVVNGVIWASFSEDTPPFREYLGETMWKPYERIFSGRKLRVVGYNRQVVQANWKLVIENIRDSYHGALLHVFLPTFGLIRPDQANAILIDESGAHSCMVSSHAEGVDVDKQEYNFDDTMQLADRRVIEAIKELEGKETASMVCAFPSVILLQQINALQIRHCVPKGPNEFELMWTHFGFEDDDEEMRARRVRQANLFGPSGYVSVDDSEIFANAQRGFAMAAEGEEAVLKMGSGGREQLNENYYVASEGAVRGLYQYYREVMEL